MWLANCGGATFLDRLWTVADSEPTKYFGESYVSTAAIVILNCIASAGPVVDSLRLEAVCGLGEEVISSHWDQLESLLDRAGTQLSDPWGEEFGKRLRQNPCRTSAVTEEGLHKIMEDIAAKAANAVHLLAAITGHPAVAKTLQTSQWTRLAEHTLALGFGYARRAEAVLQRTMRGHTSGVTIDHPMFEDGGNHLLGLRSPIGGVECTHWTHPLLVTCSVFLSRYLAISTEEPKELTLQSCLFVRRFAESRLLQCELRARALLELGIEDEPVEEWVDLCISEPSDSANPSNAALYWACCGHVCALALARTAVREGGDRLQPLHEAKMRLVLLEGLAWISPPHGRDPTQTALERCRNALITLPGEDVNSPLAKAALQLLQHARDRLASRCGMCGKAAADVAKLQVCSGCKASHYCCRKCQKGDWRRHKLLCKKSK